jgi:hypothetical protein
MNRAALGIRMHSGWGVLVAVSGAAGPPLEVIDRRRIVTTDPSIPGANQPYHHAKNLEFREAEAYLVNCATLCERGAFAAIENVVRELDRRDYRIAGSAILLASGRPLPPLAKILAAHPLLHTAEGEFFRNAVSKACERLKIPVTAIRESDLDAQAKKAFGNVAGGVRQRIVTLGRSLGPPWTKDHKTAALAAATILAQS